LAMIGESTRTLVPGRYNIEDATGLGISIPVTAADDHPYFRAGRRRCGLIIMPRDTSSSAGCSVAICARALRLSSKRR
jgi:hypothetical protein